MRPATAGTPVLETRGLTRRFGALVALDRVDLTVARGECVAVFGSNGAGKTTLFRLVTATLRPSAGTVSIAGLDPRRAEIEVRRLLGVVSHQTFLYDGLTTHENLSFFARLHGVRDPAARADELLARTGLVAKRDERVRALSRGMQQRIALARALVHEPELLLLDEPFTGLDPRAADWLHRTIEELRGEGRTILFISHDVPRGLALSDRWIFLARGRVTGAQPSRPEHRAALESGEVEGLGRGA